MGRIGLVRGGARSGKSASTMDAATHLGDRLLTPGPSEAVEPATWG